MVPERPEDTGWQAGRRALSAEIVLVLGVSLGASAVRSILAIIDRLTQGQALAQQKATLNVSVTPDRPWLDLTYQVVDIGLALVPALLAIYLLGRTDPPAQRTIGFDLRRPGFDLGGGALLALVIGIPGLGLYLAAHALGVNATVVPTDLAAHWWTTPILVLAAAENAVVEEVVVLGYLLRRLERIGWSAPAAIAVSAVLRGSYHLYQGFGGFLGNLVMGVIFALIFRRVRRVGPLVVAHTLLDVAAFVGYTIVGDPTSWF